MRGLDKRFMDAETAERLREINNAFYRDQCGSFSSTRRSPWAGWARCVEAAGMDGAGGRQELSVFDLACGNLRFEAFLEERFPATAFEFFAVDNCDGLVAERFGAALRSAVDYRSVDVLKVLMGDDAGGCDAADGGVSHLALAGGPGAADGGQGALGGLLGAAGGSGASGGELGASGGPGSSIPACDLSVSFGFMHHVPLQEHRAALLRMLVNQTRPGGSVAVSFWRFLNDASLAKKAHATHGAALEELALPPLDEGDFLLGWNNAPGAYRYCHSFSDDEIDELARSVADRASVAARFAADGRTRNLNTYLVLEVR